MKFKTRLYTNDNVFDLDSSINKNVTYKLESNDTELNKNIIKLVKSHCVQFKLNIDEITIEYCFNDSIRREIPSNIATKCAFKCIVFLKDNTDECLIVTDIDYEKYIFKRFNDAEHHVFVCRQTIGNHLFVNPEQYIYANVDNPIYTLDICAYYKEDNKKIFIHDEDKLNINYTELYVGNYLSYEYYNDIFYYRNFKHKFIDDIISNALYNEGFYKVIKGDTPENKKTDKIFNELINPPNLSILANKFIYKNILAKSTCCWLIELFKQNSNNILKMKVDIDKKSQLCNLLIFTLYNFLLPFVNKSFNFDTTKSFIINVKEVSIICETDSNVLNMNQSNLNEQFNMDVLLSEFNKTNEAYFKFKDGSVYDVRTGDAIVYYSKYKNASYTYETPVYLLRFNFEITSNMVKNNVF